MEREKRIFMDQNDYGKRKAVCRHAAGFMAAVMLAAAGYGFRLGKDSDE